MSLKLAPSGIVDRGVRRAGVFVADIFDEQQHQDVIFVLRGVHAATQFVAARPQRAVELALLNRHAMPPEI